MQNPCFYPSNLPDININSQQLDIVDQYKYF